MKNYKGMQSFRKFYNFEEFLKGYVFEFYLKKFAIQNCKDLEKFLGKNLVLGFFKRMPKKQKLQNLGFRA